MFKDQNVAEQAETFSVSADMIEFPSDWSKAAKFM